MPYKSKKQAAFIHMKAEQGAKWAKKFVKDAHGTHVKKHKAMHPKHRGR
jgi:hypothetical protein